MAASALVATPLLLQMDAHVGRRVPLGLLVTQIALAPVSWLLVWAAPDEPRFDGNGTCPDIDPGSALETLLTVLFFGSCVVGGLAVAAAYAADRPRLGRPILFALFVLAAPFGIVVALAYDTLCGWN